jgi:hypothetical protein
MDEVLLVRCCHCKHTLGYFSPIDDDGGVAMRCPACSQFSIIYNNPMLDILENPDDYEPNDEMASCPME